MRVWILGFLLIFLAVSPALADARCTCPSTGDWLINEDVMCEGEFMVLNGSLLINESGDLTLKDSVLQFNSTYDGQFGIEVNGSISVIEGSVIESKSSSAYYFFTRWMAKGMVIKDSFIHDCGYQDDWVNKLGPTTRSRGSNISNTTFSGNNYALQAISKNNNISGNRFISNEYSVFVNGSGNILSGNTIRDNKYSSLYAINGDNIRFEYNLVERNMGLIFAVNNSVIHNNTFLNNTFWGLMLGNGTDNNITNNLIKYHTIGLPGIMIIPSLHLFSMQNTRVEGNRILENGDGLTVMSSEGTLLKDNLVNQSTNYDIQMISTGPVTFENTNYTTLVKGWYFDLNVVNATGSPVPEASVVIKNNYTTTVFSGTADSYGKTETLTLNESMENGSEVLTFSPYSVNVTATGYGVNHTLFNMTSDVRLTLTLQEAETVPANLTVTIVSPMNSTYTKSDLTANRTIKVEVTGSENMTECNYSINGSIGPLSEVNPARFRAYLNTSEMEGTYEIIVVCRSIEGDLNGTTETFTVYPGRECIEDDDCDYDEVCTEEECVELECDCAYPDDHECVPYECCEDEECDEDEECEDHECEAVDCPCPEKIYDHKCNMDPGYCCSFEQCGDDEVCIDHECIEQTLSFTVPEELVVGQEVTITVTDQNGEPVENVRIKVSYPEMDEPVIETYYTESDGSVSIKIKYAGRVNFNANKAGYVSSSESGEVPEPFNFFFVLQIIILIACLAGIGFIAIRLIKGGGLKGIKLGFIGGGPLKLEKNVTGSRVILRVKNTSGKTIEGITIRDSVPKGAFIRSSVRPRVEPFDRFNDVLTWSILMLRPKERVVIQYDTKSANRGFSVKHGGKEYKA